MTGEYELDGRTAIVTGGGRGIGRACCVRLAEAGADVAVNFVANERAAAETVRLVEEAGRRAIAVGADVSQPDQVQAMLERVQSSLGDVGLLVNNAGIYDAATYAETTPELWRRTLDVNLTGVYLLTWGVLDGMIERGFGRIVNIASIAGLRARPRCIAYSVSKAGVIALTRSLAAGVAGHNVRVNAVAPGLIDTEILEGVEPERLEQLVAATPIPRMGRPQEIAELVLFLLSERSSFTTGQTYVAGGGRVTLP